MWAGGAPGLLATESECIMGNTTHFSGAVDAAGGFSVAGTAGATTTPQTAPVPTNTAPYTTISTVAAAQTAINAVAADLAAVVAALKTAGVFK